MRWRCKEERQRGMEECMLGRVVQAQGWEVGGMVWAYDPYLCHLLSGPRAECSRTKDHQAPSASSAAAFSRGMREEGERGAAVGG